MRFEDTSSRFRSTGFLPLHLDYATRPLGFRYTHIVVPTSLALDDRAALRLGAELASMHRARLTVLHVLPPPEDETPANCLAAVALLHRALDQIHRRKPSHDDLDTGERKRLQVTAFVKEAVPEHLRDCVNVCVECGTGAIEASIARFAKEAAADLVIVSTGVSRWWLPILPRRVRRLLQVARQPVILVHPDARARKNSVSTASNAANR